MKHSYMKLFAGALVVLASALTANADQTVYFEENFDWTLSTTDGTANPASILGWNTDGEAAVSGGWGGTRYDSWTDRFNSNGWTSFTGWVWLRPGFPKLSKTGYNGDIVSPALTKIEGTQTVKADFQAVGYCSAKSVQDANILELVCIGSGRITKVEGFGGAVGAVSYVDPQTADISSLVEYANGAIINLDKETGYFDPVADETGLKVWEAANTKYTITIEGATNQTRIAFIAGGKLQSAKLATTDAVYLDRVFLDNVKVYGEGAAPATKGDVNGDGKVDTSDLSALMTVILNNGTATDNPKADVNEDGKVDTTDLSALMTIILAA